MNQLQSTRRPPAPALSPAFRVPAATPLEPQIAGAVDVSVLVPAHNEEVTIETLLDGTVRALDERKLRFEIIVIDDGSTDGTGLHAVRAAQNDGGRIHVLQRHSRFGKGAALRAGAAGAMGAIIVVLDADMEYAPEEIARVVEPILQGRCDVVFGSRFIGGHDGMRLSHFLGNRVLTRATNALFQGHLTDVMTGYKAFRLSVFNKLNLDDGGFGFEVEVAAKALQAGLTIGEVPITYRRRAAGQSKIRWFDGVRCLLQLVRIKWAARET